MNDQDDLERVYAELNAGLETIEPLIEHHTRLMGQMSGRLQIVLDFLTDVETAEGWAAQSGGVRDSVSYARLLVAAVLKLANAAQMERPNDGLVSPHDFSLN